MMASPVPRAAIESAIETLIALLDVMDGDCDLEAEEDCGAEEPGEPEEDDCGAEEAGEPEGATLLYGEA